VPRVLVVDDATIPLIARSGCKSGCKSGDMTGRAFANLATPSPDFLRISLELDATVCPPKPFTPNAPPAAANQCLAKPIANARHTQ
jgi:hypothetical protein